MNTERYIWLMVCFSFLLLLNGCCKKQETKNKKKGTRYYMYDFYESNWLLVRNAVIIKEDLLNDSISILQITNHNRHIEKEYGISVVYDKKLFQKTTSKGIYFSEDSINYVLHYDFNSVNKHNTRFSTYFFSDKEKETICLDTIHKNYLQEEGSIKPNEKGEIEYKIYYQPEKNYTDFKIFAFTGIGSNLWGCNQILFTKEFNFPLFCNVDRGYYYLLSEVIGYSNADKYVKEAYDAVWNEHIFWSYEPMLPILEPSDWTYTRLSAYYEEKIKKMYKTGLSIHQIADSLNTIVERVKEVVDKIPR